MRPHVFSPNNCILRHALPIMLQVQSCKSLLCPISPILLHRSTNNSQNLLRITSIGIPRHATFFTANTCSLRKFSTRATDLNDAGSIDSPLMQAMENKIKEQINAESVIVKDAYGDGRHVSIDVVSTAFEGQSALNRQRMVYKAIWEELQTTVHAVDRMTTRTPAEAAES